MRACVPLLLQKYQGGIRSRDSATFHCNYYSLQFDETPIMSVDHASMEMGRRANSIGFTVPLCYRETSSILRHRDRRMSTRAYSACIRSRAFALRLQSVRRVVTCRGLIVPIHVFYLLLCRAPCPIGNFTPSPPLSSCSASSRSSVLLSFASHLSRFSLSPVVLTRITCLTFLLLPLPSTVNDYARPFANLTSKNGCN